MPARIVRDSPVLTQVGRHPGQTGPAEL